MRIERLPFTVYDIVGYLIPGFFVVWSFVVIMNDGSGSAIFENPRIMIFGANSLSHTATLLFMLVSSYGVGHVIGFVSSITVEKLSLYFLGYPSTYLMNPTTLEGEKLTKYITSNLKKAWLKEPRKSVHGVSCGGRRMRKKVLFNHLFLLPLVIPVLVIFVVGWFSVLLTNLPQPTINKIREKSQNDLELDVDVDVHWFKHLSYYVMNNYGNALVRMYNYLTIYGVLRNLCFISTLFSWGYLINAFFPVRYILTNGLVMRSTIEVGYIISAVCWAVVASVLFVAFIKFFRRYTEEALYAFATHDPTLHKN